MASMILSPGRAAKGAALILMWAALIFLSLLLIHNAALYFTHGGEYGILPEKQEERKIWLWNACFFIHLPAGMLCLVLPWFAFARRIPVLKRFHRWTGRLYGWITLLIVCPTGMYLGSFAKGGTITTAGFLLQGILLAVYTAQGILCARRGDPVGHASNMIRSYSIATVVLTFRALHILFFILRVPYEDNYAMSQWLGLFLNMLFAELVISALYTKSSIKPFSI